MAYTYGTAKWEQAYREMVEQRTAEAEKPYTLGTPESVSYTHLDVYKRQT